MRIGFRSTPRTSGGGAVFARHLRSALQDRQDVTSVTTFVLGDGAVDQVDDVPVTVGGNPIARRLKGDKALATALTAHPVDALVCPGTEVGRSPGAPSIMWPLTVAPFEDAAMRRLGRSPRARARWTLLRESIRQHASKADAFVFSSHYARALYQDHLPVVAQKPSTVLLPGPSVDIDPSRPWAPSREETPYALFVSHLYPYKMVEETIRGFAAAVERTGTAHELLIAGNAVDVAYRSRVESTIRDCGVTNRVRLLGNVASDQLPDLYRGADVFIFPSISENAGSYALIDAFALGTPVVSSSTSSMPEICQDAARYFDPRDPQQLADTLAPLLTDQAARRELSQRGPDRAADLNSWADIAEGLVTFIRDLP